MAVIRNLFQPLEIGTVEVRNRIAMPPIMGPGFAE
jgi:2,4-dienoyl-CoA reductase-like NADH-dependent reductase (Old Yellow Enzyme family)